MKEKLKKDNKRLFIIAGAAICLCIALVCCVLLVSGRRNNPLQEQLDLGNKYLEELDYEAALVCFLAAIEIDPMSTDAYLGAADAYVGMGNTQSALDILREGHKMTQDEKLAKRLDELQKKLLEEQEKEAREREEQERAQREKEQEEAAKQSESAAGGGENGEAPVVVVPESDDPFVEFMFAPYASENIFYNFEDESAAASFAVSAGAGSDESVVLSNGQEYSFQSGEFWDENHGEYNGSIASFVDGATTTIYEYVDGVFESVETHFGQMDDIGQAGGFADFAIKYGCTSMEDFLRVIGIADEALYTALAKDNSGYSGEIETPYGTVKISAMIYTFSSTNRYVSLTFDMDFGSPWRTIQLGNGFDALREEYWFLIMATKGDYLMQ